MWLDLSALKKINTTGSTPAPETPTMSAPTTPVETPLAVAPKITESATVKEKLNTSAPVAKFSLSSLKQGGPSAPTLAPKPQSTIIASAPIVENAEITTEKEDTWKPAVVTEEIVTVSSIVKDDLVDESSDVLIDEPSEATKGLKEVALEIISESQESTPETITADTEKTEVVEQKTEFFPNLDVLGEFDISDDEVLGSRPDILVKKEVPEVALVETPKADTVIEAVKEEALPAEETASSTETITEITQIEESEAIIATAPETEEIVMAEVTTEAITEEPLPQDPSVITDTTEETAVTPEYVAEVKHELSEERKPGGLKTFSKSLVAASVGGILFIASIGASLFSLQEGMTPLKSNVLETKTPHVTPIGPGDTLPHTEGAPKTPKTISPSDTNSYVIGKDYRSVPNAKKNIRRDKSGATTPPITPASKNPESPAPIPSKNTK